VHVIAKATAPAQSLALDLILYNAIWLTAVIAINQSPLVNDPIAIATMCLAITFWGLGSFLNSYSEFFIISEQFQLFANISYALFYPCALIALPRAIKRGRRLNAIELLDAAIFGLGISSIAAAIFVNHVFPEAVSDFQDQFFALLFPIGDLLMLALAAVAALTYRLQTRALLLFIGVAVFSLSDLFFLWLAINDQYSFGQITDDGWLLGITLISLSFWAQPDRDSYEIRIHPIFITSAIFVSPTLLALSAIKPGIFPIFILAPTIATLFLAFIRMGIVIRQARNLGEEKVLARTDELTGLPNRRRLIAELESFSKTEGALLLLDLNQFKPVNDQYGHEVGNEVLRHVARRFSRVLPTGSIIARLGGDEFGVLALGSYEETLELAYALEATLSYPIAIDNQSIVVGVSIGYVANDGSKNLLERADAAMYEAKKSGAAVVQAYPL
jgi:diguanylate cyclase (GGDEF)-like protein